ncbi:MAG TPA: IS481 family transposase, partial [Candidatus Dormibacteraeota bacterium]|nr:IS481 family transposase [Candidatus Dormibacteraeota bacterium]
RIARNGTITVGYQQFSVGKNWSGSACDVLVTDQVLQCWVGNELLKTVARNSRGDIRKKHAQGTAPRA